MGKRHLTVLFLLVLFTVAGCASAGGLPAPLSFTETPRATALLSPSSPSMPIEIGTPATHPLATETATVVSVPASPSPTIPPGIAPVQVEQVLPSPLALNEHNVALQMQLLARIGRGQVTAVAWSPVGDYLAVATGRGVYLFATDTWSETRLLESGWLPKALAFTPDGSMLAAAGERYASVWKVSTGAKLQDMEPGKERYASVALTFGPRNLLGRTGYLAGAGDPQAKSTLWNVETGEILKTGYLFATRNGVAFSPDGQLMVFPSSEPWKTEILSLPDLDVLMTEPRSVGDVLFALNGGTVLQTQPLVMEDALLVAWDISTGDTSPVLFQGNRVPCWFLKAAGAYGICYRGDAVWVLNLQDLTVETEVIPSQHFSDVSISPDGTLLALADAESVTIQNRAGETVASLSFTAFSAAAVGLSETRASYVVVTADLGGDIHLWNLETGAVIRTIAGGIGKITSLAISPDRRTLAGINNEGQLVLWQLSDGREIYTFHIPQEYTGNIRFTCNGSQIITMNGEGNVAALELSTGNVRLIGGTDLSFSYAGFPPLPFDDAGACRVNTWRYEKNGIQIQDLVTGETVALPYSAQSDYAFVEAVAVNTEGNLVAIGAAQGGEVWSLDTFQRLAQFEGHTMSGADGWFGTIRFIRFSPHSDLLLSVGYDSTTRLWNARTGQVLRVLQVCCFAEFTPDGRYLVTAGDGVIRLWGIAP